MHSFAIIAAAIFGAFLGGILLPKLKFFRALFLFGLFQALSNLIFIALLYSGKNYALLVTAVSEVYIALQIMFLVFSIISCTDL